MSNIRPNIQQGKKICIVCEGSEEYDYLTTLKQLGVWQQKYLIRLENAKGITNIPGLYQDKFQSDTYEVVLVFCDTENAPYTEYNQIKRKINKLHGKDVAKYVIFFANPCTMQIILQHFETVKLKIASKTSNEAMIKKLTGISEYRATDVQRRILMSKININNYVDMKKRINSMSHGEKTVGSTNFHKYMANVENSNDKWIKDLKKTIE